MPLGSESENSDLSLHPTSSQTGSRDASPARLTHPEADEAGVWQCRGTRPRIGQSESTPLSGDAMHMHIRRTERRVGQGHSARAVFPSEPDRSNSGQVGELSMPNHTHSSGLAATSLAQSHSPHGGPNKIL